MRAVLQRVSHASVRIDERVAGDIDQGVMVLLGVAAGDDEDKGNFLAGKIANLRIFEDAEGKMNRSLIDIGGAALVVSQFTLFADCRKGRRPYFGGGAEPARATALYEAFVASLEALGVEVATGEFAADMQVTLCNDGPVTIILDTEELARPRRD